MAPNPEPTTSLPTKAAKPLSARIEAVVKKGPKIFFRVDVIDAIAPTNVIPGEAILQILRRVVRSQNYRRLQQG